MQFAWFLHLRKHRLLAFFIIAIGFLAIWLGVDRIMGPKVEIHIAEERPLLQTIVATGQAIPVARISIGSVLLGRVKEVFVREGDNVEAGQVIAKLEDREAEATLEQARAGVKRADAKMKQLKRVSSLIFKENLRQAEVRVTKADEDLERNLQLFQKHAIAKADLDNTERSRDLARSEYQSALVQSMSTMHGGSDALLAISDLIEARASLSVAESRLENTKIAAPVSGVVLSRDVEPGDIVSPGTLVATMAQNGPTYLSVEPDEKNLAYLILGQSALASADAFPSEIFKARVSYIAPGINADRGTVEVRLLVPEPPSFLKPYMTVNVEIEVSRESKTLVLPTRILHEAASKTPWVQVVKNGRAENRRLKIGISGDNQVQVLAGIESGASVIVPSDRNIPEGARVRY